MQQEVKYDLVVVGAGIVGVSCALWANMRGLKVLIVDRNEPGSGASYGNAGTIATYACIPVNNPAILSELPKLLFSKDSPLGFSWTYVLRNMPWMISFLRNCAPRRVETIINNLGILLSHADAGLDPLIEEAACQDLMVSNDCLYVWSTQKGFDKAWPYNQLRKENGVEFDVLDEQQIKDLEPNLKLPLYKGVRYKGARHVRDPQALVQRMHTRLVERGGEWRKANATKIDSISDSVKITLESGKTVNASKVVIAAGAHGKSIEGAGIRQLPLDTERGHHISYRNLGYMVSRPVGWADAGFYATPMDTGLRIAGTVEIAGLDPKPSSNRIQYLTTKANEMFGDIGEPDEEWLGFRPTFPDALPAIGAAPNSKNILHAFGHQHIGLTLGGITGRIIADLAENRKPNFDISAFDPKRFT